MKRYVMLVAFTAIPIFMLSAQAPINGLVAYYPFNGNASDESGNGNDGIVHGTTIISDKFSNENSEYSFDGVNGYIQLPLSIIDGEEGTIACWIQLADTTYDYDTIPDPAEPRPFGQNSDDYGDLSFSDEFNATSLDESKWNKSIWYSTPSPVVNFEVSDGKLHMWPQVDNGDFAKRTVDTDYKYYQTYGYFEVEAKLPVGLGIRPAIWMLNHDTDLRPEIDIMEAYGVLYDPWASDDLHLHNYGATTWNDGVVKDRAGAVNLYPIFPFTDLSTSYHKYACRWDETGVQYYFDGEPLGAKHETTKLSSRMYFLLSLGNPNNEQKLGSGVLSKSNPYTPQGKNNSFSVNYIRVWNLSE